VPVGVSPTTRRRRSPSHRPDYLPGPSRYRPRCNAALLPLPDPARFVGESERYSRADCRTKVAMIGTMENSCLIYGCLGARWKRVHVYPLRAGGLRNSFDYNRGRHSARSARMAYLVSYGSFARVLLAVRETRKTQRVFARFARVSNLYFVFLPIHPVYAS